MKKVKYLLVGGGLASCEAIKGIRRHDREGGIAMVEQEIRLPYNRPPLSKAFLKGEKEEHDCFCAPSSFYREHKVELLLGRRAVMLDAAEQKVILDRGGEVSFDRALLATGGRPIQPPLPGLDLRDIYFLRTLDQAAAIRAAAKPSRQAVVIGAGFIGLEISASLNSLGVDVTVLELANRIWPRVADPETAELVKDYYQKRGVDILTGEKVVRFEGENRQVGQVVLESGRQLPCDFVVCAVGIELNTELAEQAGLTLDNGVVVDAGMRSSHPSIYAAGDIANYPDPYFDKRRRVEHWGQAEYTGGLAGENMAGANREYDLLTYFWSEGFDLHYEFAGEEGVYDQTLKRGRFPEDDFAALFLAEQRLRGFLSVNPEKKTQSALEELITSRVDLKGREQALAQPGSDLGKLIRDNN